MAAESEIQPALRVSQLDAAELDNELFDLLKGQLTTSFKYLKPSILTRFGPEISAALKFILWKYSISETGSSVGQQLLDLKYQDGQQKGAVAWITPTQKALLAVITILLPWLHERTPELETLTEDLPFSDKVWTAVRWFEKFHKIAALVNFLIFLQQGKYPSITMRLLQIIPVFPRPQGVRQVGFEYMNRELLWHGFAEFLFFLLPLINFRRIKNYVRKYLTRAAPGGIEERSAGDLKECVVCGEWPFNPRQIGCKHVFCYYCVMGNYEADSNYSCPACGCGIVSVEDIKPVFLTVTKLLN